MKVILRCSECGKEIVPELVTVVGLENIILKVAACSCWRKYINKVELEFAALQRSLAADGMDEEMIKNRIEEEQKKNNSG